MKQILPILYCIIPKNAFFPSVLKSKKLVVEMNFVTHFVHETKENPSK